MSSLIGMKKPTTARAGKLKRDTMQTTKGPRGFLQQHNSKTLKVPGKGAMRSSGGTISATPQMLADKKFVGTSADVYNEAASGSRPRKSVYPIGSSAPPDTHMIRPAPGPLK